MDYNRAPDFNYKVKFSLIKNCRVLFTGKTYVDANTLEEAIDAVKQMLVPMESEMVIIRSAKAVESNYSR